MKQKQGFVLRDVCGEKVIVGESIETIDFGKLISLNETAAFLWEKAAILSDFTAEQLADELQKEYEVPRRHWLTSGTYWPNGPRLALLSRSKEVQR